VEVHERELEDETHQVVEVVVGEGLGPQDLVEAALGHAVVAGVELERRAAVFDDVAVDLDAGFEVVEFVLAAVELEDFGGDALVGGHEDQVGALAAHFGQGLGEEGDLGVGDVSFLDCGDAVTEHDDLAYVCVVAFEVTDGAPDDLLEADFVFLGVTQVGHLVLGLDDVVGAEDGEVGSGVAEDGTDRGLASALFVVDGEDHGGPAVCEPLGHGLVEADFVAVVVGQFEDNVLHEVEHDHLEEVVLFEGLGEDDLAGDAAVLVAALLDHFVLAREQVLARPRVEHCDHRLGVAHVPVLALDVTHLDDVRARDFDVVQAGQVVAHLRDHVVDFLAQPGQALLDDDPALERVFVEVVRLVAHVLLDVVVALVVVALAVVRRDDCVPAQDDVAGERALDRDDVEVVGEDDAVFLEEPVRAQVLQRGVAEGLELEVLELAAFDRTLDGVVGVDVLVLHAEEAVVELDGERVALEAHVAQRAVHDGRECHDFHGRVGLLLGHEFVEVEFGVGVGELAVLEHGHQLVLGDHGAFVELLAQRLGDVAVEDGGDLVVHVEFERVGLEEVHGEFHAVHDVDVLGALHTLARLGVEERLLPEPLELDYVLLEHREDVAAVVHDRARVALLALQLDRHLERLLLALELEDGLEPLVGLRLDDLDERVVVDVAAEEHFLQFAVDVEEVQHLLPQVEVFLHADCELGFLLVEAGHAHFVEVHRLFEGEGRQVDPDLLVL